MSDKPKKHYYAHPMASVGTGVIFFYYTDATLYFLLQKRTDLPGIKHPGKIGTIGGYNDLQVMTDENGEHIFETPDQAAWRETAEEAGIDFRNQLPPNAINMDNVALILPNAEDNYLGNGEKQVNIHMIWACEITAGIAKLAIVQDPEESEDFLCISIQSLRQYASQNALVPWLNGAIGKLSSKGYF